MPVQALFPTLLYTAALGPPGAAILNRRLLRECLQLRLDDAAGRRWSAKNYPGGFTSYGSQARMQTVSPTFAELERRLNCQRRLNFDPPWTENAEVKLTHPRPCY